jgi:CBS domain-containing protein
MTCARRWTSRGAWIAERKPTLGAEAAANFELTKCASQSRKLVGMLSAHDIEQALAILATVEGKRLTLDVGDICTEDVPRVGPELPAHEAAEILIESHADGLPVVDTDGEVIGVVTATDFVEVAREALAGVDPQRRVRA